MPNKSWNLSVDLIPSADGEYNLGDANHRWKINGRDTERPYTSLERLGSYLYRVSFATLPEYKGGGVIPAGCSSFVSGGKLYHNLDWEYNEAPTFHVQCKWFYGNAFDDTMTDSELDDDKISQLPYRLADGQNENGIMMATHILYNDWEWTGSGDKNVPLGMLAYLILTNVKSMDTIATDLAGVIQNLCPDERYGEYVTQYIITDGTTTYALLPPTSQDGTYSLTNISAVPKMANFRWVNHDTVTRSADYMQDRPLGVERWNNMSTDMESLRFTLAYEEPTRLSEYIGINETDKNSTDAELTAIYNVVHQMYLDRSRDGTLWQTMHSVVYSPNGMEVLCVQENWKHNYAGTSGESGERDVIDDTTTSADTTWSSQKISSELDDVVDGVIDDSTTSADSTWSSQKISAEIQAVVTQLSQTITNTYIDNLVDSLYGN